VKLRRSIHLRTVVLEENSDDKFFCRQKFRLVETADGGPLWVGQHVLTTKPVCCLIRIVRLHINTVRQWWHWWGERVDCLSLLSDCAVRILFIPASSAEC
jgi:hypothetical protein